MKVAPSTLESVSETIPFVEDGRKKMDGKLEEKRMHLIIRVNGTTKCALCYNFHSRLFSECNEAPSKTKNFFQPITPSEAKLGVRKFSRACHRLRLFCQGL